MYPSWGVCNRHDKVISSLYQVCYQVWYCCSYKLDQVFSVFCPIGFLNPLCFCHFQYIEGSGLLLHHSLDGYSMTLLRAHNFPTRSCDQTRCTRITRVYLLSGFCLYDCGMKMLERSGNLLALWTELSSSVETSGRRHGAASLTPVSVKCPVPKIKIYDNNW